MAPFTVEVVEESIPALADNQLLVKTIVTAVSPGTEMLLYRNQMPMGVATDVSIAALGGELRYPLKYGYAAVGRVVECGSNVDKKWQDQLVFGFNPHESYFIATPNGVMRLPDGMLPETAVFLPNMETAVSLVMDGQPMIGEQIAVFGQGIVGLLTTGLLAQHPLAKLVTLDKFELRREWSRRLGANISLDPTLPDGMEQLKSALRSATVYAGADLTFELSGNPQALDMAVQMAGFNGRVVVGSWYGTKQATLNLGDHFHRNQMSLISSQVSQIRPQWNGRWSKQRRFQTVHKMLTQLNPSQLITHRYPIQQAAKAYQQSHNAPEQVIQPIFIYP